MMSKKKNLAPIGTIETRTNLTFNLTYHVCVNHYRGREHWIQATSQEEALRASKILQNQ